MMTRTQMAARRTALAVIAVPTLVQAAWLLLDPAGFHRDFLLGRGWVSAFGAFDEHLVRDVGAYALALGLVAAWALRSGDAVLARVAAVATLAASLPHLAFHATHLEPFGTADAVAQVVLLLTQVIAPLVILLAVHDGARAGAPARTAARVP